MSATLGAPAAVDLEPRDAGSEDYDRLLYALTQQLDAEGNSASLDIAVTCPVTVLGCKVVSSSVFALGLDLPQAG